MAHSNYKTPPAWGPDLDYESWKTEVEMWHAVTDLAKVVVDLIPFRGGNKNKEMHRNAHHLRNVLQ